MKYTVWLVILCSFFLWQRPVYAGEETLPDMTDMQSAKEGWTDGIELDLKGLLQRLMQGEDPVTAVQADDMLRQLAGKLCNDMTKVFRQIFLLVLCSALFRILSKIAADERTEETGFYILFMVLCTLLIREFTQDTKQIASLLQALCVFMQTSSAAYSMVILGASGSLSAAFFEQGLLLVITVIQGIVTKVFLPLLVCAVLIGICDKISQERLLSVLTEGMERFVRWGMQTAVALVTGIQILRGMLAPAFDAVRRSALGKAAEAVPGIGSMVNAAAEMLLASAVLIRNCMGIVILIVLVAGSLSPILCMAVKCGMFYLLAALAQPVADRRITGSLKVVAGGYGLCVRILTGTVVLFFIAVAVMTQIS